MASIPLVALNAKTPEQPDLLQNFGRLQALKNMQQQGQLQQQQADLQQQEAPLRLQALQQQTQSGQLGLQQQQREQDSENAVMDAYSKANGHLGKAYEIAAQSGKALPKDLEKLRQADIQAQTQAIGLVKAKGERAVQEADLFATAAYAVKKAPPEQRPAVYQQQIASLAQAGVDVSQAPQQYPGDQQFGVFSLGIQSHKNAIDQAAKQATIDRQQAETEQAAANAVETKRYHDIEAKQGQQRIGAEYARLKFDKDKEAAMTGGGNAAGLVDDIGTGKIAVDRLGYLVAKNPGLLEAVSQKYPDFDSTKAGAYVNAYKDFTSTKAGSAGGALNAGATALGHLKELKELNTVASHIPGTPAYNAYMNKVDTVATELAKFYGDSTVSGIGAIRGTLAATLPGNRDAAIATQAQSMGDKFDAYQQSWENAAPSKAYQAPMPGISEKAIEARAALDPRFHSAQVGKLTPKDSGGTIRARDPQGKLHEAPAGTPLPAGWKAE